METKWLEDFLCLAETRSFSRAAADRHITQSAFSRRIMALEEWLGVSLVDRSVHPATLTTAGWLFRRLAADLLRDAYAARALLSSRQPLAESDKVIRFSVAHTLVFTFFPSWLKYLHERFGSLSACVHAVNVPEGVQQLVDDDCDILLGYHHQQLPILLDPNGFPFLMLGVERILPFSAPDKQGQPIFRLPGTSANPLPFMAYSSGAFLGNVVEMILLNAPEPYGLQRCFETHMSEALKAMVVAGHGVGWLPESCVSDEMKEGKLVVAGPASWATSLDIRLYRSAASPKPLVDELWSFISHVRDPQLMLMGKAAESSDCGML
ncbi:LysR substrate-binding domain-containing protein [Cupriavidus basilensis]|uniref:LysR substrate-binding domain-containing protein n=1 Tax=Cupriavidus basilensis TaxID=68895 RepID=UPI00157AAE26|nr:LysR substrate-binding domain-containing protein [Cupriavidus basilensis]NUA28509.1 LysR family transcriptional regulator [Cupriavidus basilensis]